MNVAADTSRRRAVLAAVLLCSYAIAMESTVVSAAIPTVIAGFGGLSGLSWVFSAYLIAQVVTMPSFGSASDRIDRRLCFLLAAVLFSVGTLACGLAWNMWSLIVARVLQGMGAGGLLTVGTAALNDLIPQRLRGKYQALGSAVWGVAAVSGPMIGSVIMNYLDWRYIFWINLPVVLVSTLLMYAFYPVRSLERSDAKIALLPSLYLCLSLMAVMAALVHGQTMSRTQWTLCLIAAGGGTALLVDAQRRHADPLFPVGLMRMRIVKVAVASAFLCGGISMGATVYLPSYVALVLRADYLAISSAVAAITLAWTFSAIGIGLVVQSGRVRLLAVVSACVVLFGALQLCYAATSSAGVISILIDAAVLGLGLGACSVIFSVALQSAVTDTVRGAATSLFYLSRMLGQSIGVAVCGGVLAGSDDLAKTLVEQTGSVRAGRVWEQMPAAGTDSVRSEFLIVFALIAAMALLQLVFSFRTPPKPTPA